MFHVLAQQTCAFNFCFLFSKWDLYCDNIFFKWLLFRDRLWDEGILYIAFLSNWS